MTAEAREAGAHLADTVARLVATVDGLSDEQLAWRPEVAGANPLGVILTHALSAAEYHVLHNALGHEVARDRASEFVARPSIDDLRRRGDEVRARVTAALDGAGPGALEGERASGGRTFTIRWHLLHALEHLGEHLGEALLTRALLDAETRGPA